MNASQTLPEFSDFMRVARPGLVVPLHVEFPFDTETAVTAYAKLRRGGFGFLLESVIGGERWARYTFLGTEPREAWKLTGNEVSIWTPHAGWQAADRTDDPLASFAAWIGRFQPVPSLALPRFWGGAVGYFGYDTVRWFEALPPGPPADVECPDACFLLTDHLLIVDNLFNRATAVAAVHVPEDAVDEASLRDLYDEQIERLCEWLDRLSGPSGLGPLADAGVGDLETGSQILSNRTEADFCSAVRRAKEYIRAGDIFQVVLSQRIETTMRQTPLDAYRALRGLNPSPYLFLLELDGVRLIGSSPEVLVRVEEGEVTVRPIAGTRPRGSDSAEDAQLGRELKADEKERAEHLMLVDLGRNDVGRVAESGTVRLMDFMSLEQYSHVIHMVSEVTGRLKPDCRPLDAFRACFPAGTLTGAPKVRAMEIIDELEPTRRGPYGGAAGYVSFGGESLDMAIAIRTIVSVGDRAYVQAGAGIVHDSVPEREWRETRSKAEALVRVLTHGAAIPDKAS